MRVDDHSQGSNHCMLKAPAVPRTNNRSSWERQDAACLPLVTWALLNFISQLKNCASSWLSLIVNMQSTSHSSSCSLDMYKSSPDEYHISPYNDIIAFLNIRILRKHLILFFHKLVSIQMFCPSWRKLQTQIRELYMDRNIQPSQAGLIGLVRALPFFLAQMAQVQSSFHSSRLLGNNKTFRPHTCISLIHL